MVHLSHSITTLIVLLHTCMDTVSPERRIFKGRRVEISEFPFFVTILYGFGFCGGSIISPLWIVTSKHCFIDEGWITDSFVNVPLKEDKHVIAGNDELNESMSSPGAIERRIKMAVLHPKYDVALARFEQPITFNERIQRILLPRKGEGYKFTTIFAVGFGGTEENELGSGFLKASQHNFQESDQCIKEYERKEMTRLPDSKFKICVARKRGEGICIGDSGGPLVAKRAAGSPVLAGIAQDVTMVWTGKWEHCSDLDSFSFFVRTSSHLDWIYSIAGGNLSN